MNLPPLPPGGVAVTPVPLEIGVGVTPDGASVLVSIHLECGLLGFIIDTDTADQLAGQLVERSLAARSGLVLPPINGIRLGDEWPPPINPDR